MLLTFNQIKKIASEVIEEKSKHEILKNAISSSKILALNKNKRKFRRQYRFNFISAYKNVSKRQLLLEKLPQNYDKKYVINMFLGLKVIDVQEINQNSCIVEFETSQTVLNILDSAKRIESELNICISKVNNYS